MLGRLEKGLNDFLLQYEITGFALFRDWILVKSDVGSKKGANCRFMFGDNKDHLYFRVQCLDCDEINKIAKFLDSSVEYAELDLKTDPVDISLNEKLIFDELLPEFKKDVLAAYGEHPNDFRSYQLYSRGDLKPNPEAERKTKTIVNEVSKFMSAYNVSTKESDVFENTLVEMAGIKAVPIYAVYGCPAGPERTKIHIEFDADQCAGDELSKLLEFFTSRDETAFLEMVNILGRCGEDKRNKNYLVSALEDLWGHPAERCRLGDGRKYIYYIFNLDGPVVADEIVNDFKSFLSDKVAAEPECLKRYMKDKAHKYDDSVFDAIYENDADSYENYNFSRSDRLGYFSERSLVHEMGASKVVFADHVVPAAESLKVETKKSAEVHFDEFRGLYYINARDLKNNSPPSQQGLFASDNVKSKKQDDEEHSLVSMSVSKLTSLK